MSEHLLNTSEYRFEILTFHRITETEYFIPPMAFHYSAFLKLMKVLKKLNCVIDLNTAVNRIREGSFRGWRVAITFDDGYRDNCEVAGKILKQLDMPATFFIPVYQIDKGEPYWWDYLHSVYQKDHASFSAYLNHYISRNIFGGSLETDMPVCRSVVRWLNRVSDLERMGFLEKLSKEFGKYDGERLLMDWEEIRHLQNEGFSIGSHSLSHTPLTDLDFTKAENEIIKSREILEHRTGKKPDGFSYPRGAWSRELAELTRQAGYSYAVTTVFKSNRSGCHLYALSRRNIEDYQGIRSFFSTPMHLLEISGIADRFLSKRRK